jgi:glutathione S-transferase|tara:strand:- start:478 stop:1149 length:672 start_codon:yes stop_codon:yes gene_type:complete
MIELFTSATPNGHKISIALEELGLMYTVNELNLGANDQKKNSYLKLNPNGKIPAIIDHDNNDFVVFESGAILIYLAEKTGKLLPQNEYDRSITIQWLMFQMGGIGPMMGQANVFYRYWHEEYQPAIDRYQNEVKRLFGVMDVHLNGRTYLSSELSIADIACWPWVKLHEWSGLGLADFPNLSSWLNILGERPSFIKGINTPALILNDSKKDEFVVGARNMLTK